jgi:hypothetical protein
VTGSGCGEITDRDNNFAFDRKGIETQARLSFRTGRGGVHGEASLLMQQKLGDLYFAPVFVGTIIFFFLPSATTCRLVDFVVLPPGHGRSVTDL